MSLTPEQMQTALDVQSMMLANIQRGKPPHEGIDPEKIRLAISQLRSGRAATAAAAAAGRKKASGKKEKAAPIATGDLLGKLGLGSAEQGTEQSPSPLAPASPGAVAVKTAEHAATSPTPTAPAPALADLFGLK